MGPAVTSRSRLRQALRLNIQSLLASREAADYRIVIAGVMPRWRQYFNHIAGGFMCLLFAGLGWLNARILFASAADKARILFSVLFMALPVAAIASQFWFQRRIICEFGYDGCTLQYRTLGIPEMQVRPLQDLGQITLWRGRSGPIGYRLVFRDGAKVYLDFSVANSIALADQLRRDANV